MNKFFGYALAVTILSVGTSWVKMVSGPSSSSSPGSSWSSNSGSWGSGGGFGGGGGGHK